MENRETANILWFDQLHRTDVDLVGGKSSSLGELTSATDVPVPYGFATTTHAYRDFMNRTGATDKIKALLDSIHDYENSKELHEVSAKIRQIIIDSDMPTDLVDEIQQAYAELAEKVGEAQPFVAIRSSATAEDLPDASFAGQQESYLNIQGADDVVKKIKECFASLYTERATYYRHKQNFPHDQVALSATIQMMVFSKASGVMFSVNVGTGDDTKIIVDSVWGLGEYLVQGTVTPDDFLIDKETLKIVSKDVTTKNIALKRLPDGGVAEQIVPTDQANQPSLTDEQVKELAGYAKAIEKHYGCYMDMEFALDEKTNKLWLVQARPETVWSQKNKNQLIEKEEQHMAANENQTVLVKGLPASPGVATGKVHVIENPEDIDQFQPGEILVTAMTSPDWVPVMKKAKAIITNNGGRTCHAAIVSREMQIPCVVGTTSRGVAAMDVLKTGDVITVDAKNGIV